MRTERLVLVPVPAGIPAGMLSAAAWDALRGADGVIATAGAGGDAHGSWRRALDEAHAPVVDIGQDPPMPALLGALEGIVRLGQGAWLVGEAHLPAAREIARAVLAAAGAHEEDWSELPAPASAADGAAPSARLEPDAADPCGAALAGPPEAQAKGAALLRAVEVMDALLAEDGDAWSAVQSHRSLARYLLEETHEVLEAIEADGAGLPDELGDLLFQILFHARLGQDAEPPWDVDDVARAFIDKMERRNPHVFGADRAEAIGDRGDVEAIVAQWHAVKAQEAEAARAAGAPPAPSGADAWFHGIPRELPSLQRAAKIVHRARSAGRLEELLHGARRAAGGSEEGQWEGRLALALLDLAVRAEEVDSDPESALRTLLARIPAALRGAG